MEIYVAAYARGDIVNRVKQMVKNLDGYRKVLRMLEEVRKDLNMVATSFETQAQELRTHARNNVEFQRKFQDLQRRALETLKPKEQELLEIQANLKEVERQLFVELLHQQVEDEVRRIHSILDKFGLEGIRYGNLTARGRWGLATVLSLYFEADKNIFKAIKKKLEEESFQKIEVFIEEAG